MGYSENQTPALLLSECRSALTGPAPMHADATRRSVGLRSKVLLVEAVDPKVGFELKQEHLTTRCRFLGIQNRKPPAVAQ